MRFQYDVMKKKYGDNNQLLFPDTDTLMDEVCTDDLYHDMWVMKDEFDLASYPKSSSFFDPTNSNVAGNVKDEASGQSILVFVGLKAKMYSYQTLNEASQGEAGFTSKKRAKGIQTVAVAK